MKQIVKPLINWYYQNKRILSWSIDKKPYHVWVSEIMLQQTRIETVIDYYQRFMENFPTTESLATADLDKLLKFGKGYNIITALKICKKQRKSF